MQYASEFVDCEGRPAASGIPACDGSSVQESRKTWAQPEEERRRSDVLRYQFITDPKKQDETSTFAYVTLLKDDEDRGVRVLGESLKAAKSQADLVVMLTPEVSDTAESRVRNQGWIVKRIQDQSEIRTDAGAKVDIDARTYAVTTYVAAWTLTEYERIIFLDGVMLILDNIDDLFQCVGICAVMEQAELINTALLVLEPDVQIHEDMLAAVKSTYSFTPNFQGFMNSYLDGFERCSLFDPEIHSEDGNTGLNVRTAAEFPGITCRRLPTRYNGELHLMMLNGGRGMVRTKNPMPEDWWHKRNARALRFEFMGLKPWTWYAAPFMPFMFMWEDVHKRVNQYDARPQGLMMISTWLSFMLLGGMSLRHYIQKPLPTRSTSGHSGPQRGRRYPAGTGGYNPRGLVSSLIHVAVGYSALLFSVWVGAGRISEGGSVGWCWSVFIAWLCGVFTLLWIFYLGVICRRVRPSSVRSSAGSSALDLSDQDLLQNQESVREAGDKSQRHPMRESIFSLLFVVLVLALLPSWQPLSGASNLASLLGPAAIMIVVLCVFLTVQMTRLPVLWCDWRKAKLRRASR